MARKVAGYRAEGYRRFQLKVGGDPDVGRRAHPRGARGARAVRRARRRREHGLARRTRRRASCAPCATWTSTSSSPARPTRSACRSAAARTTRSCSTRRSTASAILLRAAGDLAMDVVNIKISKFGGLTRARQARDLCVSLGRRDDDRGLLGRRRDDGGDRAPGALDAAGVPLHVHRLQQLRDRLDRRGRAAARRAAAWRPRTAPGLGVAPRAGVPEERPAVDVICREALPAPASIDRLMSNRFPTPARRGPAASIDQKKFDALDSLWTKKMEEDAEDLPVLLRRRGRGQEEGRRDPGGGLAALAGRVPRRAATATTRTRVLLEIARMSPTDAAVRKDLTAHAARPASPGTRRLRRSSPSSRSRRPPTPPRSRAASRGGSRSSPTRSTSCRAAARAAWSR